MMRGTKNPPFLFGEIKYIVYICLMKKTHGYLFDHEVDLSRPRKTVFDTIFSKQYDGEEQDIPIGDLPTDLHPTDILIYHSDPGYYSENNSWEPFTEIQIQRPRLETDAEHQERIERCRLYIEGLRDSRYKTYLKLKEEFDPTNEKSEK